MYNTFYGNNLISEAMVLATTDLGTEKEVASSSPPHSQTPEPQNNTNTDEAVVEHPSSSSSNEFLVWRKPWMIAMGFFFFFYILLFSMSIIGRYWVREDWTEALPGLGKTALRKFTIRNHMTFGGIAILCSPIQMITPFTSSWKKSNASVNNNWYRRIHRYSGRVYILCAVLSFIFGQWFIFLKKFVLVGGYNMGLAFSAAGFAIAYFAYMTWKTAPSRDKDGRYTVEDHRNYAIRSFGQIIAPILYRYWYALLFIFKVYRVPDMNNGNPNADTETDKEETLVCNDRDVCGDYERPFDAIFCWFYWISAWVVSEIVIAYLPKHQQSKPSNTPKVQIIVPMLATTSEPGDNNGEGSSPNEEIADNIMDNQTATRARVVNLIGCLLAVLTAMVSGPIIIRLVAAIF